MNASQVIMPVSALIDLLFAMRWRRCNAELWRFSFEIENFVHAATEAAL